MKKEIKHNSFKSKSLSDVRFTINPKLDNVNPLGNPQKMEDAKRILSNLKGPLPWNKK